MFVSISKEAREAFILGQIQSELESLRRWKLREQEAIANIIYVENVIQDLECQLNEIE